MMFHRFRILRSRVFHHSATFEQDKCYLSNETLHLGSLKRKKCEKHVTNNDVTETCVLTPIT